MSYLLFHPFRSSGEINSTAISAVLTPTKSSSDRHVIACYILSLSLSLSLFTGSAVHVGPWPPSKSYRITGVKCDTVLHSSDLGEDVVCVSCEHGNRSFDFHEEDGLFVEQMDHHV